MTTSGDDSLSELSDNLTTSGDDRLLELSDNLAPALDWDGDDRLSELSDDLLRRILYFVPFKDAASTSVLSRRWGSLWRQSGAVNLAVQIHDSERRGYDYGGSYNYEEAEAAFYSRQEAFVHAAMAALDAAEAPITRLTLLVESNNHDDQSIINQFLHGSRDWRTHYTTGDVVGALVSHHAARHVEELCLAASSHGFLGSWCTGIYGLASLPSSDTLRVLDLTRCNLTAAFLLPRLVTLRLRHCSVAPKVLRALLDAAPELTTVQLESLIFLLPPNPQPNELEQPVIRLSFQAVTTLVLSSCDTQLQGSSDRCGKQSSWDIEIDAPRLQSFKYKGLLRRFVLRPAAAGVARVDLHFLEVQDYRETVRTLFWQFMHNFTNARTVKLKVDNDLMDIAVFGEANCTRLLQCAFPSMERLELEGAFSSVKYPELEWMHCQERETAAVAIANLLDCCPVLVEFVLKLSALSVPPAKDSRYCQELLKRKDRSDYSKSIDRFMCRRKSKTTISMEDSFFGDKYSYDDVPDIPALSGHSFACLQRTLKRVGLQFQLDNKSISRCLGLQLIKFFTNHARVLEEMYVDIGNRRLVEHLNFNVETQMSLAPTPISATASIQDKNLAKCMSEFCRISSATLDSTIDLAKSTAEFTVLPLQRQERMD